MTDDNSWHVPGQGPNGRPPHEQSPQNPGDPQYGPPTSGPYSPPGGPYGPPGQGPYGPSSAPYGAPQGPPPGWTPPPKPGLIPLRPLGFGTLLGAPFQALRRNPRGTFGSSLVIQLIVVLVSLVVTGAVTSFAISRIARASSSDIDTVAAGSVTALVLSAVVPMLISIVAAGFLQGIIVIAIARDTVGEQPRFGQLWRRAAKHLWRLTGFVALVTLALLVPIGLIILGAVLLSQIGAMGIVFAVLLTLVSVLGLIVLAVWLGTKVSLAPSAIVLERLSIRAAVARSWRLTHNYFWRTFGAQALVAIIVNFVAQVLLMPISLVFGIVMGLFAPTGAEVSTTFIVVGIIGYVVVILISVLAGAVIAVAQSGVVALIYIDLRMRKEGLDVRLTRFAEQRQAGVAEQDPFETPLHTTTK